MGRDTSDFSIDTHIADAVRHALLIYGDGVLDDPGFIEILRDHGAFHGHTCADVIVKMLFDNGHLTNLLALSHKGNVEILDGVDREVCDLRYMSSFYEKDIRNVLLSLVKGMNMNLDLDEIELNQDPDTELNPDQQILHQEILPLVRPAYDISESIEIDPDDLIEPPSCPIPQRNTKKEEMNGSNVVFTELKDVAQKEKPRRKKTMLFTSVFGLVLALSIGMSVALNQEETSQKERVIGVTHKSQSINANQEEFKRILKRGMSGSQVYNLVMGLNKANYLKQEDVTNLNDNYIYDETVEKAVLHFQKDLGIRRDGVYNTDLDEILFSFWRPEYTSCRLGKRELSTSEPTAGPDVDVLIDILSDACFISDTAKLPMSDKVEYTEKVRRMFEKAGSSRGEEIASRQHHYYCKEIKEALMHFQSFHGIKPSGELNEATMRALSDSYLRIKEKKPSSYDARPVGM